MPTISMQPSWQPHFYYEPHILSTTVRQSFDAWLDTNGQFFTDWRDSAAYPQNVGPSLRFDGNGRVSVGGKTIVDIPVRQWVHVEVKATLGKTASRSFQLTITNPGQSAKIFRDLPSRAINFMKSTGWALAAPRLQTRPSIWITCKSRLRNKPWKNGDTGTDADRALGIIPHLPGPQLGLYFVHSEAMVLMRWLGPALHLRTDNICA